MTSIMSLIEIIFYLLIFVGFTAMVIWLYLADPDEYNEYIEDES